MQHNIPQRKYDNIQRPFWFKAKIKWFETNHKSKNIVIKFSL